MLQKERPDASPLPVLFYVDIIPRSARMKIGVAVLAVGHFPVRGVMPMVTWTGLFSFCLVIVGVISLCVNHKK